MALIYKSIEILLWAKNLGVSFERTLTLGRQNIQCSKRDLHSAFRKFGVAGSPEEIDRCLPASPSQPFFGDNLLHLLGAKEVVSVDYSDFEGATLIHDLNQPFPESEKGKASLVIDGGTMEHIFDYPSALRNILESIRVGGHFLTLTGVHSFMGHGFYQFSPELFFRVFSPENGFILRKIVIYEFLKHNPKFYEVKDPAITGIRTELVSKHPMGMAVLAQRISEMPILVKPPMQSDYSAAWTVKNQAENSTSLALGFIQKLRVRMMPYWPTWLRNLKNHYLYRRHNGFPTLHNKRHYRLIKPQEIYSERAQP